MRLTVLFFSLICLFSVSQSHAGVMISSTVVQSASVDTQLGGPFATLMPRETTLPTELTNNFEESMFEYYGITSAPPSTSFGNSTATYAMTVVVTSTSSVNGGTINFGGNGFGGQRPDNGAPDANNVFFNDILGTMSYNGVGIVLDNSLFPPEARFATLIDTKYFNFRLYDPNPFTDLSPSNGYSGDTRGLTLSVRITLDKPLDGYQPVTSVAASTVPEPNSMIVFTIAGAFVGFRSRRKFTRG